MTCSPMLGVALQEVQRLRAVRAAAVAAVLAVLGACGSGPGITPNPGTSGIDVLTMAGPTCPVQQSGQTCEKAISAVVLVRDSAGHAVTTVQTGADGRAHVPLLPGTYSVAPQKTADGQPRAPAAVNVTVRSGAYQAVRFDYDTGMR